MRKVLIHTDGSCDCNPGGPGGWAAILEFPAEDLKLELRGRVDAPTTSNRMELTAAIEALKSLREWCEVDLITDSQYLQRGASEWMNGWHAKGWRRKRFSGGEDIPNADLWRQIWDLHLKHSIKWKWVRGHGDCAENCRADLLASRKA